ncbi:MAG: hypothetical protein MJ252_28880 [archaeon]|nr:hypothetical protein [archaeon]
MFGDKCCYIHPSIPCKYGIYCTRIGCSYTHPAGFNPGMGIMPNLVRPIPPFMTGKKKFSSKGTTNEGEVSQANENNAQTQPIDENKENTEAVQGNEVTGANNS